MAGMDEILRRVPGNYLQAIFSSWLASHFIYNCRLQGDEIDFHKFLEQLKPGANQS
jgi:glutamate dehydrogenase